MPPLGIFFEAAREPRQGMVADRLLGGGDVAGGNENDFQSRLNAPFSVERLLIFPAANGGALAGHPELAKGTGRPVGPAPTHVRIDVEAGALLGGTGREFR